MVVRDRGSMLLLVVFVGVAFTAAIGAAMVPVLDDLVDRQQARSAADAAALAGVVNGRDAAATVASRNGAVLVGWSRSGDEVTVTVSVDGESASARATDGP